MSFSVIVSFRGHATEISVKVDGAKPGSITTLEALGRAIEAQLDVSYESIKLLGAGRSFVPSIKGHETVEASGGQAGRPAPAPDPASCLLLCLQCSMRLALSCSRRAGA